MKLKYFDERVEMSWTYWCFILWAGSLVLLWRLSPFLCLVSASSRSIFRPFVRAILAMIFRLENKNPACQVCTQGQLYDSGSTVHNYQGAKNEQEIRFGFSKILPSLVSLRKNKTFQSLSRTFWTKKKHKPTKNLNSRLFFSHVLEIIFFTKFSKYSFYRLSALNRGLKHFSW